MKVVMSKDNLAQFEIKFNKLIKIANKLKVPAPTFVVTNNRRVLRDDETGLPYYIHMVDVIIEGAAPKLDGWVFVSKLDHVEKISFSSGHVPSQYTVDRSGCEHCCVNRPRSTTYVVKNDVGLHMQVGGSCLKHYMGHRLPSTVSSYFNALNDLECGFSNAIKEYDLSEVIGCALHWIENHGYEKGYTPLAVSKIFADPELRKEFAAGMTIVTDHKDRVDAVLQFMLNMSGSDYATNVNSVAKNGYVSSRAFAFAVSAVQCYLADVRKKAVGGNVNSVHLGEVGAKIKDIDATVVHIKYIDGAYDVTSIVNMVDSNGNVLVWFAAGYKEFEIGRSYKLSGTIKRLDEFNGTKQTILTRCKLN